jgi:hypothetical protein
MGIAPTSGDRVGEVLMRATGDGPATWAMGSLFERLASAAEADEEIRRWNEVSPRYGLRVVGPPIPSET